ncbi:MAG: MFS transporter [Luteolibacter sp.]
METIQTSSAQNGEETPSKSPWMAIFMLSVGSFIFINTEFLPIGMLSDIAKFYGINVGRAGLMVTIPGIAAAISALLLTRFLGRANRKSILLSLTGLLLLSNLTIAISPNFELALFGRLLLGIGVGGFWAFAVPYGINIVRDNHKGRATTIITAGIAAGTVAGVPLGTFLGAQLGWQNAFLLNAGLSAVIFIMQLITLPSLRGESALNFADMVRVVMEKSVAKRLVSTFTFAAAHFCAFTYFELILTRQAGLRQELLPAMFLLYGCTGFVGTFVAEFFVKRLTAKNSFRLATITLLFAVFLMLFASVSFVAAVGLTLLWGLAYGIMPVSINIWLYEANEKEYVVSTASNSALYQVAVAAGSFAGGIAFNNSGIPATIALSVAIGLVCYGVSFIKTDR